MLRIRNTYFVLIGTATYAICQWLALLIVARSLGAVEVGQFGLALAVTAPLFMLFSLRLRYVYGADLASRFQPTDYIRVRIGSSGLATVLAIGIGIALFDSASWPLVLIAVAVFKFVESVSDVLLGVHHLTNRWDRVMHSQNAAGVAYAGAFAIGVFFFDSLVAACVLMVVFRCLTLLIDSRMFGRSRALQRSEATNSGARQSSVWSLAIAAAPLSIAGFFDSISTSMPRLAAARWCTAEDLGIFVAINYVGVAVVLAMNSIYYSRITAFASLYAAGSWRRLSLAVARLAGVSFFVAAAAVLMAVLIGDKAIGLVYGQDFVSGHRLLCWTLAGAGVTCVSLVGVVLLTAVGRYRAIGLVYLGYTIILSFALYVGGQSGDTESIAIAAFIAGFFQMLIVSVLVFRTLRWATPQVAGVV